MTNAPETRLESRMRDGRLIVTFDTDLGPGPHGPDDLHYLHVERVRRQLDLIGGVVARRGFADLGRWSV